MSVLLASSANGWGVGPKAPEPVVRLSLEALGFQPPAPRVAAQAGTLLTLNYVDEHHLLLTFYTRALMPRLPDAQPEDADGVVAAMLLELPSAKVLARTEWRLRDRDPYLWSLGHGRFLLRIRTKLMLLDPLTNLPSGQAFRQEPFGDFKRRIGYISVSPDGDLLTIETVPPPKPKLTGGAASAAALAATQPTDKAKEDQADHRKAEVQVLFYRLHLERNEGKGDRLERRNAGGLLSPGLVNVPANADGFVSITRETSSVYNFDFVSHAGQKTELAAFDTTCSPHPYFVSRSEFVALGCHGGVDKPELGGFNLKGEHAWIEVLAGDHVSPIILGAPAAGRFALSRITLNGAFIDPQNVVPEEMTSQEISVRQNHDGRVLLKLQATPIQRMGQNFDISPDGLGMAIVRAGSVEIYKLPPLTGKDLQQVKRASMMEPSRNDARILLNARPVKNREGSEVLPAAASEELTSGAATSPAATQAPNKVLETETAPKALPGQPTVAAPATRVVPSGDEPQEHRQPPTLYDGEHPKKPKE